MLKSTSIRKIVWGGVITALVVVNGACLTQSMTPQELPSAPDAPTREQIAAANGTEYFFDYSWADNTTYIAHALGGILGTTYTNSYEAFLLNYSLGQRVFEADMILTEDGQLVLAHSAADWQASATIDDLSVSSSDAFTYNNFKSSLVAGQFHTLSLEDLLTLMAEYPDVYIITDTKSANSATVETQFTALVEAATAIDASLLDRIIPQIYTEAMLDELMAIYDWQSVIYTLYSDPDWTDESVAEFMARTGVNFITLWGSWSTAERISYWKTANPEAIIAAHTINSLDEVAELQANGVDLIYTDYLWP